MQNFFNSALGSENHSFAAESRAQTAPPRLQNNAADKKKRDDYLDDIDDKFDVHTY